MTSADLAEKYVALYGTPPRSRNKDFLRKRLAWRIQELAEGGLSERALARIEELGAEAFATWHRPCSRQDRDAATGIRLAAHTRSPSPARSGRCSRGSTGRPSTG